jgi:tetratricopeptide (TPR) repeat protein
MEKEQNWRQAYALFLRAVELDPNHTGALTHLGRLYAMSGAPEKAIEAADKVLVLKPGDAAAMVLKGLAKARMGNKEDAIRDVEAAVKVDSANMDAISLLSALYADLGDMDKAVALAKKGMEDNPKHMGIHLLLARMYEKSGNTEGTVDLLQRMITIQPDNQTNRNRLAAYYHAKGKKDEAVQVLRDSISANQGSSDPKLALVEYLGKDKSTREQAEKELQKFVKENPDDYKLQFALAKIYLATKRVDEAKSLYQSISDEDKDGKDGAAARTKIAGLLMMEKKLDEAKALVDGVLAADPKNKDALLTRSAISLASDDPDKGIADLRTLLGEDPGHVKGLRLKARAHLSKKEIALARESLEAAIQVSPQEAAANFELAQLLVQTGKPDDAIAVLEKMQKFAPDHAGIMLGIAKIYTAQRKWDEVVKISKEMQIKHPKKATGYYYHGLALQGSGKLNDSVDLLERSLKISPNAVEPLIAVAKSWLALKQPDKSLERVQQAIAHNSENFLAYNLKGEILVTQKRLDEAAAAFQKASEINPKWAVPYSNLAKLSLVEKDVAKAITILEQGHQNTKDLKLAIELASIYDSNNDEAKARELYEQLLVSRPDLDVVKNNLAMMLVRGEPKREDLDKALELTKDFTLSENPIYMDTLGWVRFMRGENKEALVLLKRAYAKGLKIPDISYHLGMAYQKAGNIKEAKGRLEESLGYGRPFDGMEQAKLTLDAIKAQEAAAGEAKAEGAKTE